jgi:chromosome partitioning protein
MTDVVAFLNPVAGVGSTTLAYHLAYMVARKGVPTLAVDLDPQADLTSMCFDDERLEELWNSGERTIHAAFGPNAEGPVPLEIDERLSVIPGDLRLARLENTLDDAWVRAREGSTEAVRMTVALHRFLRATAARIGAQVVFVDIGPNLGAINRAGLLAADHVVIPLASDVLSLRGLATMGPAMRDWRRDWKRDVVPHAVSADLDVPAGEMSALGYVVLQHAVRRDRPVTASKQFLAGIPQVYAEALDEGERHSSGEDPRRLGTLRNFGSLIALAREARKPIFDLRAADGALGSTARLAQISFSEFSALADTLLARIGVQMESYR